MTKNYCNGKYSAFGHGQEGPKVGDLGVDGLLMSDNGLWAYYINGLDVYDREGGMHVASIDEQGVVTEFGGHFLFRLALSR